MAILRVTSNCLTAAWMASLLSVAVVALDTPNATAAQIGVCRSDTPCPCAADGTCRPKRETFGSYHTRWRPWPGDPQQKGATLGDDQTAEDKQELKSFERPTPEKEGNREPAKTKSFESPETDNPEASIEEPMSEEPLSEQAAEDIFPDLDDQGSYQPLPLQDDAPPALPPSLRKFAATNQLAQPVAPQPPQANHARKSVAIVPSATPMATSNKPLQRPIRRPEPISPIIQATAQQHTSSGTNRYSSMNLVNPAANGTYQGAQQAIYYEATDKP